MGKALISIVSCCALALSACSEPAPTETSKTSAAEGTDEGRIFKDAGATVARPCEGGGIATGDEVAVSNDVQLRSAPGKSGKPIINEKATAALGETYYQKVDSSEQLREMCRQKEWSKVQVMDPALSFIEGWLPVSSLRAIERDTSGKRKYVADDFYWDKGTSKYKPQIVANVNKIVRENERCDDIDPGTVARSKDRSTPGSPVFFVTCKSGSSYFNVWFKPGDAAAGKIFHAIRNVDQGSAVLACERAAKLAANNPQTVNFSTFMDVAFVPYPNGNSRLVSTFTAKNAFGVEGKFNIECFFEGMTLTDRKLSEAID